MAHIELNKKNFYHNLDICSTQAKSKDKIAIVLKDNAYGHGLEQIASLASSYGITKAIVQTIDEANKIKDYFKYILILADVRNESLSHTFHITINNIDDIGLLAPNTNIHIKIDTGMHRNGISPDQLEIAINRALEHKLNICGIFTHFKNADSLGSEYFTQKMIFKGVLDELEQLCEKLNLSNIKVHSANSSALFRETNFSEDICRLGIAVYGYIENQHPLTIPNLKPILSLFTNKISSRTIKKGQSIGYGGNYTASKDMEISTYDIGYGDGFKRIPVGSNYNISKELQILGNISMDSLSINSTKDTICLFDNVNDLAKLHNTISYEILTSLNPNLKRVII